MVERPAESWQVHDTEYSRHAERDCALHLVERARLADWYMGQRKNALGKALLDLVHGVIDLAAHGEIEPFDPVRDAQHRPRDVRPIEIGD